MENKSNIPKLRFPEFSVEWKKKKLGDVTTYVDYRGRAPIKTDSGIFLVTAKNIKKGYIDYESSQEFVADDNYLNVMSKGLPEIGDILFTTEAPMGNVAQVDNKNIALAQRVIKFRGNEKILNLYLLHYMLSDIFQNKLFEKAIGTTVQGISGKELHKIKLDFPSLPEQQKIASFLSAVDDKLQALKKKKSLLEQYKKGVMQRIFNYDPSNDEFRIRFKADDGSEFPEWEVKKLGEVCEIVGGGTPETNVSEYWQGKIQWFTPTEIKSDYVSKSIRTITEIGLKKSSAKLLPIGTILLTTRATIGEAAIALEECSTNQGFQSLIVKGNMNNVYVFNWIKENKFELTKRANGSTFPEISKTEIEQIEIQVPSLPEQTKIANFLSAIDEKIQLINDQIEKMELWKKGLLQKMFV
jgi:type I restriction enzyme S subunit